MATITNLFTNPSAEANVSTWTGDGSTISRDTTTASRGGASIKVVTAAAGQPGLRCAAIPATIGQAFRVSLDWKGSASVRIRFSERNASLASLTAADSSPITLSDEWTRSSFAHTISNASTAYIYVYMSATAAIATTFWADGLLLHEGSKEVAYFDGDSPNAEWTGTAHASTSVLTLPDRRIFPILKVGSQHIGPLRAGKA